MGLLGYGFGWLAGLSGCFGCVCVFVFYVGVSCWFGIVRVLVWLLFCCFGFVYVSLHVCLRPGLGGSVVSIVLVLWMERLLRGIWLLLIWGCLRLLVRSFVSVASAGWFDVMASVVLLGWACLRMLVLRVWYNVVQFSWWPGVWVVSFSCCVLVVCRICGCGVFGVDSVAVLGLVLVTPQIWECVVGFDGLVWLAFSFGGLA